MNRTTIMIRIFLFLLLVNLSSAWAEDDLKNADIQLGPLKPFGIDSITVEQEQQILDIEDRLKFKLQSLSPRSLEMEQNVKFWEELIKTVPFDRDKAELALRLYNEKQLDGQIMKIKAEYDIYHVLTPKQKKTLERRRQERCD